MKAAPVIEQQLTMDIVLPGFIQFGDVPRVALPALRQTISEVPHVNGRVEDWRGTP